MAIDATRRFASSTEREWRNKAPAKDGENLASHISKERVRVAQVLPMPVTVPPPVVNDASPRAGGGVPVIDAKNGDKIVRHVQNQISEEFPDFALKAGLVWQGLKLMPEVAKCLMAPEFCREPSLSAFSAPDNPAGNQTPPSVATRPLGALPPSLVPEETTRHIVGGGFASGAPLRLPTHTGSAPTRVPDQLPGFIATDGNGPTI